MTSDLIACSQFKECSSQHALGHACISRSCDPESSLAHHASVTVNHQACVTGDQITCSQLKEYFKSTCFESHADHAPVAVNHRMHTTFM